MSPLYCWATSKKKKRKRIKLKPELLKHLLMWSYLRWYFKLICLYFFCVFYLLNKDLFSLPISDLGAPMVQKRNILVEVHCLFLLYLWYSSPSSLTETPAVWKAPFICLLETRAHQQHSQQADGSDLVSLHRERSVHPVRSSRRQDERQGWRWPTVHAWKVHVEGKVPTAKSWGPAWRKPEAGLEADTPGMLLRQDMGAQSWDGKRCLCHGQGTGGGPLWGWSGLLVPLGPCRDTELRYTQRCCVLQQGSG